ncbi:MAG: hypothetical protein P0Y49_10425 [Candidatus Pedobacter colombiensis]|uniref:Uncharacterized protein n=1 Tax=Candidatus Pedobacter colombiensis TaxID=3121371 RepID=A0AAJ5WFD6_9SPHI|nr:hypothetical protein [Pedobacter sp.]WEK21552.1 MAG: hypothetical protein P0Y49_10425 [Pedobacter sp.]
MYASKLRLTLHWLLFITGFYLCWGFAYLILARFAIAQFNRFKQNNANEWSQLTSTDLFWYAMFIFGVAVAIFVIKIFIKYAPNRKVAILIYASLIILSVLVLVDKLLETTTFFNILPHIFINIAFLVPIIIMFFKAPEKITDQEADQDDE